VQHCADILAIDTAYSMSDMLLYFRTIIRQKRRGQESRPNFGLPPPCKIREGVALNLWYTFGAVRGLCAEWAIQHIFYACFSKGGIFKLLTITVGGSAHIIWHDIGLSLALQRVIAAYCSNFEHVAFFSPPLGLRDNVRCSSWAHWKTRNGLPISVNWTFFARCYD